MNNQKRMKTSTIDLFRDQKKSQKCLNHKKVVKKLGQKSSNHLKSFSKDISRATFLDLTPKKTIQHSKKKHKSRKESSKAKHMNSCINYSLHDHSEKQTIIITKRKNSNVTKIQKNIKNKAQQFKVLTRCLTEFAIEQRKLGRNPNAQIIKLIKAFNASEIGQLSNELQIFIKDILQYIEKVVGQSKSQSLGDTKISKQVEYSKNLTIDEQDETNVKKKKCQNQNQLTSKKLQFSEDDYQHNRMEQNISLGVQIEEQIKQIQQKFDSIYVAKQNLEKALELKQKDRQNLQRIISQQKKALQNYTDSSASNQSSDNQNKPIRNVLRHHDQYKFYQ